MIFFLQSGSPFCPVSFNGDEGFYERSKQIYHQHIPQYPLHTLLLPPYQRILHKENISACVGDCIHTAFSVTSLVPAPRCGAYGIWENCGMQWSDAMYQRDTTSMVRYRGRVQWWYRDGFRDWSNVGSEWICLLQMTRGGYLPELLLLPWKLGKPPRKGEISC